MKDVFEVRMLKSLKKKRDNEIIWGKKSNDSCFSPSATPYSFKYRVNNSKAKSNENEKVGRVIHTAVKERDSNLSLVDLLDPE